jgi:predicted NBD/HSP70 family sugar kinase
VARAGWALGIGISDALNLVDIPKVVLGTGLAPLVPYLLPAIRREFDTRLLAARFIEVSVEGAPADPSPASTGGALLALDRVISHPADWLPTG